MFRKIIACLMLVAAFATVCGIVPGLAESVAYACDPNDPACGE